VLCIRKEHDSRFGRYLESVPPVLA
jgi:hypothetical protein